MRINKFINEKNANLDWVPLNFNSSEINSNKKCKQNKNSSYLLRENKKDNKRCSWPKYQTPWKILHYYIKLY